MAIGIKARRICGALAGAAVLALVSGQFATIGATQPESSERQNIERAVQAYASRLQAQEDQARDQLIAANATELLNDPATPVIGDPRGDVAIVEFFDYACPYCKAVEPRLEKFLKDDRRVKLVAKEFPILTPESLIGAKAALAAARQGKYQRFHQALMGFKGPLREETIFAVAKDSGLDVARLRHDMDAPDIADAIIADFNLARATRIVETPSFIVAGHLIATPSAKIDFPSLVAAARHAR